MQKKTIIILTIVSTLLSLIYIILLYFGLTRYLSLRIKSSKKLIENYSKIPRVDNNTRTIISFTTVPDRINKIQPMINSILDQTKRVDQIVLVIPYKYKDKKYDIPQFVKDVANVVPSGKDYGQGTKFIPVLLREKECDTIIIALNDNVIYGADFIETITDEAKTHPDTVITDNKKYAILTRPACYGCDIINRDQDKFDDTWFINNAKHKITIKYTENYAF